MLYVIKEKTADFRCILVTKPATLCRLVLPLFYRCLLYASFEELPEKYGVVGFDRAGNPLEIVYNPIDDNTIFVFHAMRARDSFIEMVGL